MINYGYPGEEDITSTPDIEYTNNLSDELNADEKSNLGKSSFLNSGL